MTTPKLVITVIGDTEVGRGIAAALSAAGHSVLLVGDRVERIGESDLVLLAVSGSALTELISSFTERDLWRPGQLVAHTAGEFGYSVLAPAVACGVIPLAIHPAMRFTGTSLDLMQIRDAHFAITAPNIALPIAQALVIEMGGEPLVVAEADRAKYAEAIDVASSFSALVVGQAIGLLNEINIQAGREVLGPLVRSAVEQALAQGYKAPEIDELTDETGF